MAGPVKHNGTNTPVKHTVNSNNQRRALVLDISITVFPCQARLRR
ncbi:hypothetical protein XSR1_10256 [Xenorhabdus szentirmaii DSM 16338]|uniref:Uncharacterized protein n=1 Tax=Xenorhabdus szentirmaii DSM 16338 TaxID=1427518 RepID=W1IQU8_9GAMM|nr:hypothetical protein XSR1_10256 [Xenorhabdus szentirmaii DSM 16338]